MEAIQTALLALSLAVNAYAAQFTPEQQVIDLVGRYGTELATTTRQQIIETIRCESGFNPLAVGKLGELGLVQIYPKYHPTVSREEALDPDFAVKFIINAVKDGHQSWWSCWK